MYILACFDDSYYVGSTVDLSKRLKEHMAGRGANHTKTRLPVRLVYHEEFEHIYSAWMRERQIHNWSHKKKKALHRKRP